MDLAALNARVAIIGNSAHSFVDFRLSLIGELVVRGATVHALAPDFDPRSAALLQAAGAIPVTYSIARNSINPFSDMTTVLSLRRKLQQLQPDAVLSYFMKPAIYGTAAAALLRVPRRIAMLEGLGYGFSTGGRQPIRQRIAGAALRALLRHSLRRACRTLVLNEDDRQAILDISKLPLDGVVNIGGIGVALDAYEPAPPTGPAKVFALAARLIAEKGVLDYVEAARRLKRRRPDARFLLLGATDDNPTALTRAQVQAWVDEGIIEWPGRVDDVRPWIGQADVFVLPSYYREGVPRSIQEAMALGKPIITTDNVGCRDTVEHEINGFVIPVRDRDALTAAMERLAASRDLPGQMGAASRKMAEEKFDASRTDRLIADLLLNS